MLFGFMIIIIWIMTHLFKVENIENHKCPNPQVPHVTKNPKWHSKISNSTKDERYEIRKYGFLQISLNSLGPESREEQTNLENKIMRNVLKEVVIDKSRKIIENL